jgi:GGDEF domain-containing protein
MVELAIRFSLLAIGMFGLWYYRQPNLMSHLEAGAFVATYSGFLYLLERRGMRSPLVSSVVSALDAAAIAALLVTTGTSGTLGIFAAVPLAYAVRYHGVSGTFVAPLAGALILSAHNLLAQSPITESLILQAIAGFCMCIFSDRPAESKVIAPKSESLQIEGLTLENFRSAVIETDNEEFDQLKESYRKLREHSQNLESRSKKNHWIVELTEAVHQESGQPLQNLASRLRGICQAKGLTLYSSGTSAGSLVVQAFSGDVPAQVQTRRISVGRDQSESVMRECATRALRDTKEDSHTTTVVLRARQRMIGMIWIQCDDEDDLARARETIEFLGDTLGQLVQDVLQVQVMKARERELEVLYQVSSVSLGSETPGTLLARVIRELKDSITSDTIAAYVLDGEELISVASEGTPMRLVEAMSFARGPGIPGWLKLGAPDLLIADTHDDPRVNKDFLMKSRIGSYGLVPIRVGETIYGALSAASIRAGGLSDRDLQSLQLIARELGQAISRLDGSMKSGGGLVTPQELQEILSTKSGSLIILDPLRKEELKTEFGNHALDHCIKKFSASLRSMLPNGGVVCRRDEDIVVFVPDLDELAARQWANEAAASASMMSFHAPDTGRLTPFAVRAKVSNFQPMAQQPINPVEITSSL